MSVPSNLIPTRIVDLPDYTGASLAGYLPFSYGGVTHRISGAALAAGGSASAERVRNLLTLAASAARAGLRPFSLAASLPAVGAHSATTAIATGTDWYPDTYPGRYSWMGGAWANAGQNFHPWNKTWSPTECHFGDGSNPANVPAQVGGGRVRFTCAAPKLEIYARFSNAPNGFRLKVDGEYVYTGTLGGDDAHNGNPRYIPVQWGDGTATYRKVRHYELEFRAAGGFCGIRTANLYEPQAWEPADKLRLLVHADSMTSTITDSGLQGSALTTVAGGLLGDMLGQPDCWHSSVGGTGFYNDSNGTRSTFLERVAIDIIAPAPDVIIECGGKNDQMYIPGTITQAQFQAMVESWLSQVITAKPETVIFMTSQLCSSGAESSTAAALAVKAAKQAAAAKYPKNVAFIDTLANPWVTGTGNIFATVGNGNADWVQGDSHHSIEGQTWLASCLARAVAAAIPALIAAQA